MNEHVNHLKARLEDLMARPARYIVVHIPSVDKWAIGFDLTELMGRHVFAGGYVGIIADDGHYTF